MCKLFCVLLFLVIVSVCNGRAFLKFSDSYTTKGTLHIPYAEIHEPFYAWYDFNTNSSRIDYYGGMVKTFQLGSAGAYGKSIKVTPTTTDSAANVDTCFEIDGSDTYKIQTQTVLPDISQFEYAGEDTINGLACSKWSLTNTYGDKVNKYTIWTRSKKSLSAKGDETVIPVRYEMKGFNTLLGSHYDHYYLDYEWFSPDAPDNNIFYVGNYSCKSFLGSEADHIYTFNPMKEFVHHHDRHVKTAFEEFKTTHGKSYESEKEHVQRLDLFRQNLRFIHSHNRAGRSFQLGVNHLADRTDLELRALRGYRPSQRVLREGKGQKPFPYSQEEIDEMKKSLPESLDWRLNGAVTPVKDQSVCGSCWSFGTTGAIEGAYFLKHSKLVKMSQQALIDCSWGAGNNGCDGGLDYNSYEWILNHNGIPTEDEYGPYLGQDGYCHLNKTTNRVKLTGYVQVKSGKSPDALKVAMAVHGPISVAIDASHKSFSFYSHGVYFEPQCGNTQIDLDHAVVAVGYGKMNGEDYWLIKNSWSTYWGNDGYVLMSQRDNNCGVATQPTYVTL
ncbi:hypothetical protein RUM44_000406 [Polyplax serrata]|uniref:Counting factor associated protein D n=1 Tax=Polyplax serrata TaxID=468196 RepID=A0ABR1B5U4_POLSC